MALEEYKRKRDFSNTPEPEGSLPEPHQNRYVVQRHAARRLHFDLRLEMEGVLRSWAVPKGPSMNPDDKRLAIHTEDHPIKYLDFQGTIPKGNYGAGEMMIWDKGTYTSYKHPEDQEGLIEEYRNGRLYLSLEGQQLKGHFILLQTKGREKNHWLLIKQDDAHSVGFEYDAEKIEPFSSPQTTRNAQQDDSGVSLEQRVKPMLATLAGHAFSDPNWLYELKYDGYRIMANVQNHSATIYSRNGHIYDEKFPKVIRSLRTIPHEILLDGEMIVVDSEGRPLFEALQNYKPNNTKDQIRYMIFDLLYLNGYSTKEIKLVERKELLRALIPEDSPYLRYCDHVVEDGLSLFEEATSQNMEGIIAKRMESLYYPGTRSNDWLKIKHINTEDVLICGYTLSEKRGRPFGSLILGMNHNGFLTYSGNCGTGFTHDKMEELFKSFQPLKSDHSPFQNVINLKGRTPQWMDPKLVCEIKFSEITTNGRFRHPVFIRMRPDKMRIENNHVKSNIKQSSFSSNVSDDTSIEVNNIQISLSNLEKLYWHDAGIRKFDLLDYYIKVSDTILPYLVDRPQNMHRHPNGINEEGFYQKDQEHLPGWAESIKIYSKSSDKNINYLLCQNEATLLYMINLGCIEINPWLSRVGSIEKPDYAVIDLDPSSSNTFQEVIDIAIEIKKVMDSAGIPGMAKTSGSKGIHIYLPMSAKYSYEQVRDFARLICIIVHNRNPALTTIERSLKKRGPKIYLDFLQNRRGQTVAAPYCIRPVPGALASTPLRWEELDQGISLYDFDIYTLPDRLEKLGDIFSRVLTDTIEMTSAVEKLGDMI